MKSNLGLSEEQLEKIKECSSTFLEIWEIAVCIGVSQQQLTQAIKDKTHQAHQYFYQGRLPEKVKHINNLKELADRGSSPAQAMIDKYIQKSEPQ